MTSPPSSEDSGPVTGKGLGILPVLVTRPAEAFRRLHTDPQWVGPFVLVLVLYAVAGWIRMPQDAYLQYEATEGLLERVGADDETIDEALASLPDPDNLTAGDVAASVAQAAAGLAAISFLGVLVFWMIGKLAGPQPGFRQASAVYWAANVVRAVGTLALAIVVRSADTVEVSLSPAAFVPGLEWGSVPYVLLNMFDVFSVATLYLLAVGARWTFATTKSTGWVIGGTFWTLSALLGFATQLGASWMMGRL